MIKNIKSKLSFIFKVLPPLLLAYSYDLNKWIKYSIKKNNGYKNQRQDQASLLLLLHSLEKGMSLENVRKGFGKAKADTLFIKLKLYLQKYGKDEVSLLSIGVLKEFISHPDSGKTKELTSGFKILLQENAIVKEQLYGGVKPILKELNLPFDNSFNELYSIAASRSSIRSFSCNPITRAEINNAIKYAQTAPSVCNRQASKVYIYEGAQIQEVLNTQLGNQGWAHKANKLFVITSDLNYFGTVYERNQAYIDGGMFSMQFVMGLHTQKIASCCKMYIRKPNLDKWFHKATKIPENEIPIMLILAGHYQFNSVNVPFSYRFNSSNIIISDSIELTESNE